jgi:hypothetical protein
VLRREPAREHRQGRDREARLYERVDAFHLDLPLFSDRQFLAHSVLAWKVFFSGSHLGKRDLGLKVGTSIEKRWRQELGARLLTPNAPL